jgi:hypothetical protein
MGMVFKCIEYMNGRSFENLSRTSVPKSKEENLLPANIASIFSQALLKAQPWL